MARGKPDEAIAQFTLANKKGPKFADALEGWGEASPDAALRDSLRWLLESAGMNPSFLIGGVARLTIASRQAGAEGASITVDGGAPGRVQPAARNPVEGRLGAR